MSSRRYPTTELYDERRDDFYRSNGRGGRQADVDIDIDVDIHQGRGPERRRQPDFLREEYGRTNAGPLVLRGREPEEFERPASRPRRPEREYERDEVVVRRREGERPREREYERDEVIVKRSEREPERTRPRAREVEETDIILKWEETQRPRARPREVEETDVIIRREESERPRPRARERDIEREEIIIRRQEEERRRAEVEKETLVFRSRDRSPPALRPIAREREELVFRRRLPSPSPPPPVREREEVIVRRRVPSPSPPPPPRQEREEIIVRRRVPSPSPPPPPRQEREEIIVRRRVPSPSPPPPPPQAQEEIIIRRRERSPSPSFPAPRPPPPEPQVVTRPTINQEIVTHHHHHHYDHGVVRVPSPSPSPPPRAPPLAVKDESLEIEIKRREGGRGARTVVEEDITIERKERAREPEYREERPRRAREEIDVTIQDEVGYYDKKVADRAHIGEAYNGYTRDWAIVDVPPGTERVQMDGVGGASQEITWQRYNGVRRSKFIPERDAYALDYRRGDRRVGYPRPREMWTEITKDLVIKEAIEKMGYDYEETEYFFYVFEYLRYNDILELVELSDFIRRDRRERIREIQWEREEVDDRRSRREYDEILFEREVVYDTRRPIRYR